MRAENSSQTFRSAEAAQALSGSRVPDHYVIDTNVYIAAFRDPARREALQRFHTRAGTRLLMHSVVVLELRAGVKTDAHRLALEEIISPFAECGRIVVPGWSAYEQAGRVLADLADRENLSLSTAPRSLTNDVVIATSCREHGAVLVTDNAADFAAIKRHLRGFQYIAPWPLK